MNQLTKAAYLPDPDEGKQLYTATEGGLIDLGRGKPKKWFRILIPLLSLLVFVGFIGFLSFGPKLSSEDIASSYQEMTIRWVGSVKKDSIETVAGDDFRKKNSQQLGNLAYLQCWESLSDANAKISSVTTAEIAADKRATTAKVMTTVLDSRLTAISSFNSRNLAAKQGCSSLVDSMFSIESRNRGWMLGAGYVHSTLHDEKGNYLGELVTVRWSNTVSEVFVQYPDRQTADRMQPAWIAMGLRADLVKGAKEQT